MNFHVNQKPICNNSNNCTECKDNPIQRLIFSLTPFKTSSIFSRYSRKRTIFQHAVELSELT